MSKRRKALTVALIIVVLLVAFRLALPSIVLHYANKTLSDMEGYRGHVEDIDIALIRGAYTIDSIYLNKYDSALDKQTPFFAAKTVDLSIEWRALFKGELVGELIFHDPILRFTRNKVEPKDVRKDSASFEELKDDFMPLRVNRFEAKNGRIQYIDETSKPRVDIQLSNADIVATNLRNSYDSGELLPSTITVKATVYEGTMTLNAKVNPLAEDPTFDMNAELKGMNLVKVNDFFKAYAKVDVHKGTFGLYTEMAAKEGKFEGYVKPLLKNLDVLGPEDRKDNVLRKLWEAFAEGIGEVFENQPKDRVATKVPIRGTVKDLDTNVWYAIGEVLRNAFIQALQPSIDQEINIQTVETGKEDKKNFLEKIFDKDDKSDKNKKKG
jgi:hypothetical protein